VTSVTPQKTLYSVDSERNGF